MEGFLHNPETVFFGVSMSILVVLFLYDHYHYNPECMASYHCTPILPTPVYFLYFILILFWAWILSLLTKYGYGFYSWIFFFVPFVLHFLGFRFTHPNPNPTSITGLQYFV